MLAKLRKKSRKIFPIWTVITQKNFRYSILKRLVNVLNLVREPINRQFRHSRKSMKCTWSLKINKNSLVSGLSKSLIMVKKPRKWTKSWIKVIKSSASPTMVSCSSTKRYNLSSTSAGYSKTPTVTQKKTLYLISSTHPKAVSNQLPINFCTTWTKYSNQNHAKSSSKTVWSQTP